MSDKKILVIEEGNLIIEIIKKCCSSEHISIIRESNPDGIFKILLESRPDVIAIDPYAFGSFGFQLIKKLLNHEKAPVIVAVSEKKDPEIIVQLIKSGIYDYIVLNRDFVETRNKILHACDTAELHKLRKMHGSELSVLNGYFSTHHNNGKVKHIKQDAALISSIRGNFSQGGGIGSILTLISMIAQKGVHNGDKISIDSNMFKMLEENAGQVRRLIDAFERLETLVSENANLLYEPLDLLQTIINNEYRKVSPIATKYGKKIIVSEKISWDNRFLKWNASYFEMIINELLWNAVKFSPSKSEIMVLSENVNHGILISVINPPVQNIYGTVGLPDDLKNMVFEPFFRLSRHVFEEIPTLDFGLGLTKVNMLIKKIHGSIKLSSLESYLDMGEQPRQMISMEVWLPVYSKSIAGYTTQKSIDKSLDHR